MFTTIQDLLNSKNKDVFETAVYAERLQNELKAGTITPDEYEELSNDLLDLKKIDDLSATIEHKAELKEAFDFLRTFIKTV